MNDELLQVLKDIRDALRLIAINAESMQVGVAETANAATAIAEQMDADIED